MDETKPFVSAHSHFCLGSKTFFTLVKYLMYMYMTNALCGFWVDVALRAARLYSLTPSRNFSVSFFYYRLVSFEQFSRPFNAALIVLYCMVEEDMRNWTYHEKTGLRSAFEFQRWHLWQHYWSWTNALNIERNALNKHWEKLLLVNRYFNTQTFLDFVLCFNAKLSKKIRLGKRSFNWKK